MDRYAFYLGQYIGSYAEKSWQKSFDKKFVSGTKRIRVWLASQLCPDAVFEVMVHVYVEMNVNYAPLIQNISHFCCEKTCFLVRRRLWSTEKKAKKSKFAIVHFAAATKASHSIYKFFFLLSYKTDPGTSLPLNILNSTIFFLKNCSHIFFENLKYFAGRFMTCSETAFAQCYT